MTTNPSPENTAPEPAATRWSIGDIPPEPGTGTVIRDRNGVTWTREATGWHRAGRVSLVGGTPWARLLIECGPLTRLVPADAEHEDTVDRLIRVNDTLRAELARYRGADGAPRFTESDLDRAAVTSGLRRDVVRAARRLLAGHATVGTVSHDDLDDLRRSVDALDRSLVTSADADG